MTLFPLPRGGNTFITPTVKVVPSVKIQSINLIYMMVLHQDFKYIEDNYQHR